MNQSQNQSPTDLNQVESQNNLLQEKFRKAKASLIESRKETIQRRVKENQAMQNSQTNSTPTTQD